MRRLAALAALGALSLGLLAVGPAALAQALDLDIDVDAGDHPDVGITVVAPQPLVGTAVPADAFAVTENGEARDIDVSRLPSDDLQVILLIDTSGSMAAGGAMPATRDAAAGFVESMPASAQVAVIEFNDEPGVRSPLSSDMDAHVEAIESLRPSGETALYDAVGAALDALPEADGDAPRAVVLLSDGGDTVSGAELADATGALEASDVVLYAIELVTNESDSESLEALARAGGGEMVSADDPDGLAEVYDQVAAKLVDRYLLEYSSEAHDRAELRVTIDHDGVEAEAIRELSLPAAPDDPDDAEAAAAPPPPREGSVVELGWFGTREAMIVGVGALSAGLLVLLIALLTPGEGRSQLAGAADRARGGGSEGRRLPGITELANRATGLAERTLRRRGRVSGLNRLLEQAGMALRPGELVVLLASGAVTALAIGWLVQGPLLGIVLAVATAVVGRMAVRFRADRRKAAFADQLSDTLQLLAGTLRAGYGLMQAIDSVARESQSPTAEEYRRMLVETRLGRDVGDALAAMADRVGNEDFEWVVQAIDIHREVGGDLAEVLDAVAATIRERNQIRRQVKALSAEGRLSALILFALPFCVAGFFAMTNPPYLTELLIDPIGWAMLAFGTVLLAVGGLWLKKTVKLVF